MLHLAMLTLPLVHSLVVALMVLAMSQMHSKTVVDLLDVGNISLGSSKYLI